MPTALDHIEIRYRTNDPVGAWTNLILQPGQTSVSISGVSRGVSYQVEARAVGKNGGASAWVQQTHVVSDPSAASLGLLLDIQTQYGIGPASLIAEAYTDGTAGIECNPFSATLGTKSVSYFPSGEQTITGLVQQTLYYIYVIDPTLSGGDLTPQATTNQADYLDKPGYLFVGSIVTPYAATSGGGGGGGTGARYYPSILQDIGSRTTSNPDAAFDGDLTSFAAISGVSGGFVTSYGEAIIQGDPNISLSADSTLTIIADVTVVGTAGHMGSASITPTIGGTVQTSQNFTADAAKATYTWTVPAGTPLSSISIDIVAQPSQDTISTSPPRYFSNGVTVGVYEIYIQA